MRISLHTLIKNVYKIIAVSKWTLLNTNFGVYAIFTGIRIHTSIWLRVFLTSASTLMLVNCKKKVSQKKILKQATMILP